MNNTSDKTDDNNTIEIDLRNRGLAAFLAWLWPGSGHLYQRRHAKGILFMVCILGTFFFGLAIGDGHVVYADFKMKEDGQGLGLFRKLVSRLERWHYVPQLAAGAPALPALIQRYRVDHGQEPSTEECEQRAEDRGGKTRNRAHRVLPTLREAPVDSPRDHLDREVETFAETVRGRQEPEPDHQYSLHFFDSGVRLVP